MTHVLSLSRFIHKGGMENRRDTATKTAGNSRNGEKRDIGEKGRGSTLTTSRV